MGKPSSLRVFEAFRAFGFGMSGGGCAQDPTVNSIKLEHGLWTISDGIPFN